MSMYVDLIVRLHEDAAAAANELIQVRRASDEPLKAEAGDCITTLVAGRWHARINRAGWLGGITSEAATGYSSEVEALCSLVERARRDAEDAGGIAPLHLLGRLAQDADALRVYRAQLARILKGGLRGMLDALHELDEVAEASAYVGVFEGLRRATACADVIATRGTDTKG